MVTGLKDTELERLRERARVAREPITVEPKVVVSLVDEVQGLRGQVALLVSDGTRDRLAREGERLLVARLTEELAEVSARIEELQAVEDRREAELQRALVAASDFANRLGIVVRWSRRTLEAFNDLEAGASSWMEANGNSGQSSPSNS